MYVLVHNVGVLLLNAYLDQADFWYHGYYRGLLLCIRWIHIHPWNGRPLPLCESVYLYNWQKTLHMSNQ